MSIKTIGIARCPCGKKAMDINARIFRCSCGAEVPVKFYVPRETLAALLATLEAVRNQLLCPEEFEPVSDWEHYPDLPYEVVIVHLDESGKVIGEELVRRHSLLSEAIHTQQASTRAIVDRYYRAELRAIRAG